MSLFGTNTGFSTGGFGNATTDSHNPMKVCLNLDQAQRSYTVDKILRALLFPFYIKLRKFNFDLDFQWNFLHCILEVNGCYVYIFHEYGLSVLLHLHVIDFVIIYVVLN